MKKRTKTMIQAITGFTIALIGVGLLINQDLIGKNALLYGVALNFLGMFLILTARFHVFFWKKET